MSIRERNRRHCRADHANKVEFQKSARPPSVLNRRPEHPKSDHVEEPVAETGMQEAIRDDLPNPAVLNHVERPKHAVETDIPAYGKPRQLKQLHEQKNPGVDSNQPRHCSCERWQAQRHWFPSSSHRLTSLQFYSFRGCPTSG